MEMLTRDHVKAYKDKIKGALVEYMAMPASERSSGAIRAMLEGWMLLDEVEPSLCGCGDFTQADAEKWAQHMRNTDGSTGAHRAFLLDEDGPGPKPKMSAYYCGIVKGKD